MDKPAEFTIDARAAGKGDLNLYAQVGHCPVLPPPLPWAGTLGGWGQVRGRANCNIARLTLSWIQKNYGKLKILCFLVIILTYFTKSIFCCTNNFSTERWFD